MLDVDRYAELLMAEFGVKEHRSDSGMENVLQALAHQLAAATTRKKRAGFVDATKLAKNWKIGVEAAKRTVEATTQLSETLPRQQEVED